MQKRRVITFLLGWLCVSCVSLTVNVYFPTSQIEKAAEEIEDRVRTGKGIEGLNSSFDPAIRQQKRYIAIGIDAVSAYAADDSDINIDINTPVVKAIIESRTKRFKEIDPYMADGTFGEGMEGYLVLRKKEGLDLKTMTTLKKLVLEENKDREKLYLEILRANGLDADEKNLKRVGGIFAKAIRKKLKEGRWYQVDEDTWAQQTKEDAEKNK